MSETFDQIRELIQRGEVKVSHHGYDEMTADGLYAKEVFDSLPDARVVEDYPEYPKGPCVLVLQNDRSGKPIHVLWGIPKGKESPAVLITAYRPDPERWEPGFLRRRR